MTLTKLEEYVAITRTLAQQGPLKPAQIAVLTKIAKAKLEEYLDFLLEQGVIKEQPSKKTVLYTTSDRGIKILKFFGVETSIEALPGKVYG